MALFSGIKPSSKFSKPQLSLFAVIFACLGGYILWSASHAAPIYKTTVKQNSDKIGRLFFLSRQLDLAADDLGHNPGKKAKLQPQLKNIAQQRRADLEDLFKTDPASARKMIISKSSLTTLKQNDADVEQPVTLIGKAGVLQIDNQDGDQMFDQITTPDGKQYTLDTEQQIPAVKIGSTIKVTGFILGDQLLVDQKPDTSTLPPPSSNSMPASLTLAANGTTLAPVTVLSASAASFTTTGTITYAIVLANFAGSSDTLDMNKVKAVVNGTPGADLASFLSENSYGKATLSPTFFGPYNIPSVSCGNKNTEDNAIDSAAASDNLTNYEINVYVTNCNEGNLFSAAGTGSRFNYIGDNYDIHNYSHELSHTMSAVSIGINHGGYLDCAPQTFVSPVNSYFDYGACIDSEYEDPYDTLGGLPYGFSGHLSASHKLDAGWLDASQATTVTTPGTSSYTLKPYETGSGLVALKIPRGNTGTYFTVEYRQPLGFDSYINQNNCQTIKCNANQGALLRFAGLYFTGPGGGTDSNIIDTTPGSNLNPASYSPADDEADGTLLPGQIFTDSDYNITIKTISVDASGLNMQVTLGALSCTRAEPSVSPATPSLQTAAPGETKVFTFTVTNNDSAGCTDNQFRYVPGIISNDKFGNLNAVSVSAAPDYFSLSPGASKTITLTVTSTTNATDGDYLTTYQGGGYIYSKTYGVSSVMVPGVDYRISSAADATPPSQPGNPSAIAIGSATASVSWSPSSDNIGVVAYQVIINNGGSSSANMTTNTAALFSSLLPNSTYSVTIQAFDHKGNGSTLASASFTTPAQTDFTRPNIPGNLDVTATDHSYTVSWQKPNDNVGVAYYYTNTAPCPTFNCIIPANQTSYTVNSPSSFPVNKLSLYALDAAGNSSVLRGNQISFTTAVQGDPQAPTQPKQLYAVRHTASGSLITWQPSSDDKAISGYYVYRGAGRVAFVTTTTYTDTSAYGGDFRVQAVDADGSLSPISSDFTIGGSNAGSSDTTPPTVTITSPINNATLSGTVSLQSTASDNASLGRVGYYIDGSYINDGSSSSPYSLSLDTKQYSDGPHWLVAEASDNSSNSGASAVVNLVINNFGNGTVKPGDVNGDGSVNITDLSTLLSHFGSSGSLSSGDCNADGVVNILDLSIVLSHYGT